MHCVTIPARSLAFVSLFQSLDYARKTCAAHEMFHSCVLNTIHSNNCYTLTETRVRLHIQCPLVLADFDQKWKASTKFSKISQKQNYMKISSLVLMPLYADWQADWRQRRKRWNLQLFTYGSMSHFNNYKQWRTASSYKTNTQICSIYICLHCDVKLPSRLCTSRSRLVAPDFYRFVRTLSIQHQRKQGASASHDGGMEIKVYTFLISILHRTE
jgi:hypothetical protein